MQVPLAKSGKLLGGNTNHSHLWVDPDTHDLLEASLPSPMLPSPMLAGAEASATPGAPTGAAADAAAEADTPTPPPTRLRDQLQQWEWQHQREAQQQQQLQQQGLPPGDPMLCDSPVVGPAARAAAASARKTPAGEQLLQAALPPASSASATPLLSYTRLPAAFLGRSFHVLPRSLVCAGMRESVAVFGDLSRACQGLGLDDFDGADFAMQASGEAGGQAGTRRQRFPHSHERWRLAVRPARTPPPPHPTPRVCICPAGLQ